MGKADARPLLGLLFAALTVFASCTDEKNAVQQYGNTIVQPLKSAKKLDADVTVEQVQKSIQEFYAANGRYPADLHELTAFNGMTLKNDNYEYNPTTGILTQKP
jgi:hypothetical protein